jgi:hypothetical protein
MGLSAMKRDRELTEQAYADGAFVDKKKRSYVAQKMHPGTDHPCVFLRGTDRSIRRAQLFKRAKGICAGCGRYRDEEHGDMSHELSRGKGGCDCWENLAWRCTFFVANCHTSLHPQPMWTKRA